MEKQSNDNMGRCPIESTLSIISGKWKILIIKALAQGPMRYGALSREISQVSTKVLTQQLREMEDDGLITRTVLSAMPPHVEYDLSKMGMSLATILEILRSWGLNHDDVHNVECTECHKCMDVIFRHNEAAEKER